MSNLLPDISVPFDGNLGVGVDFFELPANYRKAGDVVAEINKRFSNG